MPCCVLYKPFYITIKEATYVDLPEYVPPRCYTTPGVSEVRCGTREEVENTRSARTRLSRNINIQYLGVIQSSSTVLLVRRAQLERSVHVECNHYVKLPTTTCSPGYTAYRRHRVPPRLIVSNNIGWHTYAKAVNPFLLGKRLFITTANAVYGAFIGISSRLIDKFSLSTFTWGLMFTVDGVDVFERGRPVYRLSSIYTVNDDVYIQYAKIGDKYRIIYCFNAVTYISNEITTGSDLFVYASLYDAGDSILCAAYDNLPSSVATALLNVNSNLRSVHRLNNTLYNHSLLYATSSFSGVPTPFSILHTYAQISAVRGVDVFCKLPALLGVASEGGYSFVNLILPRFIFSLFDIETAYTPPTPVRIFGVLPYFSLFCLCVTVHSDVVHSQLPSIISLASEYPYSMVSAVMPAFRMFAIERTHLYINAHSILAAASVYNGAFLPINGFWDFAYGYRKYIKRP